MKAFLIAEGVLRVWLMLFLFFGVPSALVGSLIAAVSRLWLPIPFLSFAAACLLLRRWLTQHPLHHPLELSHDLFYTVTIATPPLMAGGLIGFAAVRIFKNRRKRATAATS